MSGPVDILSIAEHLKRSGFPHVGTASDLVRALSQSFTGYNSVFVCQPKESASFIDTSMATVFTVTSTIEIVIFARNFSYSEITGKDEENRIDYYVSKVRQALSSFRPVVIGHELTASSLRKSGVSGIKQTTAERVAWSEIFTCEYKYRTTDNE